MLGWSKTLLFLLGHYLVSAVSSLETADSLSHPSQ